MQYVAAPSVIAIDCRNKSLRNRQFYLLPGWQGGLYASPGISGSRSGGLVAATWASMKSLGKKGYLKYARVAIDGGTDFLLLLYLG